ncbi:MAG: hypothetical protein HRU14_04735 [Planctomycetes bacterium]|nr:hypothetical protein [Planctomycetota bacterium]
MAVLVGMAWLAVLLVANAALLLRPESLRRQVDLALVELFRSHVEYDSFEGSWPDDLVLRDVRIMRPDRPEDLLASVKEIHIGVAWTGAVLGGSTVEEITVVSPPLELPWNANGVLDLPSPLAEGGYEEDDSLPRVKVEGMSIHLEHTPFLFQPDVHIELPDFRVTLVPDSSDDWLYQFRGSIENEHYGDLDAFGHLSESDLDLELSRRDFVLTPRMREILRPNLVAMLDRFKIAGDIQLVGELKSVPEEEESRRGVGVRFHARIELGDADVSVMASGQDDPPRSQSVSQLRGVIEYADGRFKIKDEIIGFFEGARLRLGGHVDFSRDSLGIKIAGELLDLEIDKKFVERLADLPHPGGEVSEQLTEWGLLGPVDIAFNLAQDPGLGGENRLVPNLVVHLKGCDLKYKGFPYLLRNLRGEIQLDETGLRMRSLHATDGPLSLLARGTVDYSRRGDETYSAHVWVSGLSVDEKLYKALEPDVAPMLRDLRMQGSVDLQVVAERVQGDPIGIDPEVIIGLNGLRLHPKHFPYLLEDARGQVVVGRDGWVTFESLTVRHREARLHAWGRVGTGPNAGAFRASVGLRNVALDDALRVGLKELAPEVVEVLDDFSVQGAIEHAEVNVEGLAGRPDPSVDATLYLDGVSIAPKDPDVKIGDIDAVAEIWHRSGQSRISIEKGGKCSIAGERFDVEAGFRFGSDWFCKLKAGDFTLDEEMLTALEGVLPDLKVRDVRPKIDGQASATVAIQGGVGVPTRVSADLEAAGLKVVPPGWTKTWLDDTSCKVHIDKTGVRVTELVARIPRPKDLPPLPSPPTRGGAQPFQVEPAIILRIGSADISPSSSGVRVDMADLELSNVSLETWVLDVLGMSKAEQEALEIPPRAGIMNLRFKSVAVGEHSVLLLGGAAELMGVYIGGDADLYFDQGLLKNFEFTLDRHGKITFGQTKETEFIATDFRLFGIPVPHLEARVQGNNRGLTLTGIVGTLFGVERDLSPDLFSVDLNAVDAIRSPEKRRVARLNARLKLRDRAIYMGYLKPREARKKTAAELLEIIDREEQFDLEDADEATLRRHAVEKFYLSRARAGRMNAAQLSKEIQKKRRSPPLGVIWGETSNLSVTWDGEFSLDADLRDIRVGNALMNLETSEKDIGGHMNGHLTLGGALADPDTWKGNGWVKAAGVDLGQLPFFFEIFRVFMDPTTLLASGVDSDLQLKFDVGGSVVTIPEAKLKYSGVEIDLEQPASITFGGIIKARCGIEHTRGLIPLVSDILGVIPGLLLDGVTVEGPLEDPKVTASSFGPGEGTPGTAGGRKPLLKPPRRAGGR